MWRVPHLIHGVVIFVFFTLWWFREEVKQLFNVREGQDLVLNKENEPKRIIVEKRFENGVVAAAYHRMICRGTSWSKCNVTAELKSKSLGVGDQDSVAPPSKRTKAGRQAKNLTK